MLREHTEILRRAMAPTVGLVSLMDIRVRYQASFTGQVSSPARYGPCEHGESFSSEWKI